MGTGDTWAGDVFMNEDPNLPKSKIYNKHKLFSDDMAQLSKMFKIANEGPIFKDLIIVIVKTLNLLFEVYQLE